MAVRFPDTQAVDSAETHINHSYDHLIACVNEERTPGELWYPHGVALDSNKNQIYVAERHFWEIRATSHACPSSQKQESS